MRSKIVNIDEYVSTFPQEKQIVPSEDSLKICFFLLSQRRIYSAVVVLGLMLQEQPLFANGQLSNIVSNYISRAQSEINLSAVV